MFQLGINGSEKFCCFFLFVKNLSQKSNGFGQIRQGIEGNTDQMNRLIFESRCHFFVKIGNKNQFRVLCADKINGRGKKSADTGFAHCFRRIHVVICQALNSIACTNGKNQFRDSRNQRNCTFRLFLYGHTAMIRILKRDRIRKTGQDICEQKKRQCTYSRKGFAAKI